MENCKHCGLPATVVLREVDTDNRVFICQDCLVTLYQKCEKEFKYLN